MRTLIKSILFSTIAIILFANIAHCQDTQDLIKQASELYINSEAIGNGKIAGFSIAALIGGFLFSGIGFVAFIYGKKNEEFRPMIMGILLMGYPYFVKETLLMYIIGIALTFVLFYWRE